MNKEGLKEIDFELLSFIVDKNAKNTSFSQREIAEALKISLGMTNNILKKVVKTGLVLASKLDGKRINYILTPSGAKHLYSKSIKYFKNISKNAYQFKDIISKETVKIKNNGYAKIILLGNSGLDFIIEYCAIKNNIEFKHIVELKKEEEIIKQHNTEKIFYFIAEESEISKKLSNSFEAKSINLDKLILESFISGESR